MKTPKSQQVMFVGMGGTGCSEIIRIREMLNHRLQVMDKTWKQNNKLAEEKGR